MGIKKLGNAWEGTDFSDFSIIFGKGHFKFEKYDFLILTHICGYFFWALFLKEIRNYLKKNIKYETQKKNSFIKYQRHIKRLRQTEPDH